MTNRPRIHCTFCHYRHATGTLEITRTWAYVGEPACASCAREALTYYAKRGGITARFITAP